MVAFISKAQEFRLWKKHIGTILNDYFVRHGIEPVELSDFPDCPYFEWYEDGILPEVAAEVVLEYFQG